MHHERNNHQADLLRPNPDSHFIVNNILEGMIWFFVPASLVICNDIFAYICGESRLKQKLLCEGSWESELCLSVSPDVGRQNVWKDVVVQVEPQEDRRGFRRSVLLHFDLCRLRESPLVQVQALELILAPLDASGERSSCDSLT